VTDNLGRITLYGYDASGDLVSVTLLANTADQVSYQFDEFFALDVMRGRDQQCFLTDKWRSPSMEEGVEFVCASRSMTRNYSPSRFFTEADEVSCYTPYILVDRH
jgi:YD repeat-containing protein